MGAPLRPPLANVKAKTRRGRKRANIPTPLRKAALECAQRLKAEYGPQFAGDRRLKRNVARLIESKLPPAARRPGRPPQYQLVSAAIQLRNKLRRTRPKLSPKEIWREIYHRLIPDGDALEKQQLRQRAHWRLNGRRRRRRSGKPRAELSVL